MRASIAEASRMRTWARWVRLVNADQEVAAPGTGDHRRAAADGILRRKENVKRGQGDTERESEGEDV
jgi:hypothetical protein